MCIGAKRSKGPEGYIRYESRRHVGKFFYQSVRQLIGRDHSFSQLSARLCSPNVVLSIDGDPDGTAHQCKIIFFRHVAHAAIV